MFCEKLGHLLVECSSMFCEKIGHNVTFKSLFEAMLIFDYVFVFVLEKVREVILLNRQ
jgi:hypothetical protein